LPALLGDLVVGANDFERAFIALRIGAPTALGFGHDLAGVFGGEGAG
jgi:hypothetical protein